MCSFAKIGVLAMIGAVCVWWAWPLPREPDRRVGRSDLRPPTDRERKQHAEEVAKARAQADELPPSWSLKEIEDAMPRYCAGRVYVLARTSGSCLVLGDEGNGWCLAHLKKVDRNRKVENSPWYHHAPEPAWRLSSNTQLVMEKCPSSDQFQSRLRFADHHKRFENRPTNKDVFAALEEVNWNFDQSPDNEDCHVCEKTWFDAIGEKPTRFFKP